jgi:replicative DNA helicase
MSDPIHISVAAADAFEYIDKRATGQIKSLKTGLPKLDAANIDGFEWGSTVTLGARPSVGKTIFTSVLIRGALENNNYPFEILDCSYEMAYTVMLIREVSAAMRKSYKYILSAENNSLTEAEKEEIREYLEEKVAQLPIHYIEVPQSPKEWKDTVRRHVDKVKKPLLVRVDHTLLAKVSAQDGDPVTMLRSLMSAANELKKESPLINLFLNQLKPEFESRQEDGTQNAFPKQSDMYYGDTVNQFSETMILLNKPSKYGVQYYGNTGHGVAVEEHDLFAHVVKNRNAKPDLIIRYKEDFETMSLKEL